MNPFRYGAVLDDAWGATWSQWGIWRFSLLWMIGLGASIGVPLSLLLGGVVLAIERGRFGLLIAACVAFVFGIIATFAISAAGLAGTLGMADEALRGGRPRVADGLGAAGRSWLRVLGFQMVICLVGLVVIGVLAAVTVGPIVLAALAGSEEAVAGGVVAAVVGSVALYVVVLIGSVVIGAVGTPYLMAAQGAIVLDGAGVGGAFRQGWRAVRHHFKASLLTSLMMIGISYGFSLATSFVIQPVAYLSALPVLAMTKSEQSEPTMWIVLLVLLFVVIYAVALVATIPSLVFMYVGWMSFYRQLTGRDTPATRKAAATPPSAEVAS